MASDFLSEWSLLRELTTVSQQYIVAEAGFSGNRFLRNKNFFHFHLINSSNGRIKRLKINLRKLKQLMFEEDILPTENCMKFYTKTK